MHTFQFHCQRGLLLTQLYIESFVAMESEGEDICLTQHSFKISCDTQYVEDALQSASLPPGLHQQSHHAVEDTAEDGTESAREAHIAPALRPLLHQCTLYWKWMVPVAN